MRSAFFIGRILFLYFCAIFLKTSSIERTTWEVFSEQSQQASCVTDLFYGTDYNSHLGTKRGGLATYSEERGFIRSIHNLESTYFRTKFEGELDKFKGNAGIGIISDTDAQPYYY